MSEKNFICIEGSLIDINSIGGLLLRGNYYEIYIHNNSLEISKSHGDLICRELNKAKKIINPDDMIIDKLKNKYDKIIFYKSGHHQKIKEEEQYSKTMY